MSVARAAQSFPGTVHEAEHCWQDTSRWPAWVDGLERVVETTGDWPNAGATVIWQSGPAGRGRVSEQVIAYEPLAKLTVRVTDDQIEGRQQTQFTPSDDRVEVELTLEYEITDRSFFTPLIDLLFIRRLMAASLTRTLTSFGAELAARRTVATED